jgi:hypothetical protein
VLHLLKSYFPSFTAEHGPGKIIRPGQGLVLT